MNLLVVDDEPIIRIGLRTLVPWEDHGLRYYGEAADGVEALDLLQQGDIDILVTDIRMPRMDGLELIRQTKQIDKEIGIVVLSCLDDFSYVKEAMKLGAFDYVLKPTMEPEQLLDILCNVKEQLAVERLRTERFNAWQLELAQSRLYQLAARTSRYLKEPIQDDSLESELFSQDKSLYTLYVNLPPQMNSPEERQNEGSCLLTVNAVDNGYIELHAGDDTASLKSAFHEAYESAKRLEQLLMKEGSICASFDRRFLICIGPAIRDLEGLRRNLELHQRQLHAYYYGPSKERIIWETSAFKPSDGLLPYEYRGDLLRAIQYHNFDSVMHAADRMIETLKNSKPELSKVHSFVFELMSLAAGYAREQGYHRIDDFEQDYVTFEAIQSVMHVDDLRLWLRKALSELKDARSGALGSAISSNVFIRSAIQYMKANFHRNIGTIDIAEHVKLSRSYLSDLYSKETGEPLIESLTRIRIEEAKKQLLSGELRIYEIAESVGFSDARSFAKTFKRIVGCSPKEFVSQNK